MLHFKNGLRSLLTKFLDVLYPPKCIACNQNVDSAHTFCSKCWSRVEFISEPCCSTCCLPLPADYLGNRCYTCSELKPKFDETSSVFRYDSFTKKLIHDLKFNDKTQYAKSFASLMYLNSCKMIYEADIIIAVPMHKTNLQNRKYNHALLIASNLSKFSGTQLMPDLLVKVKPSLSQVGLKRHERMQNLKNTFLVSKPTLVKGKTIVLVDDVMTTGATANECATTLKKAGAKRVKVVTLARTY